MRPNGFTLIELLIVVAIIGILAAIAIPNFLEAQVRAKVARARADMNAMNTAVEAYYVDNNQVFPARIRHERIIIQQCFVDFEVKNLSDITIGLPVVGQDG